jgi:hypothetical protein
MVQRECHEQNIKQPHYYFSRKDIRAFTQWSDGQLKIHCKRLEEMEYLLVRQGGRGQIIHYELLYSGDTETDTAQLMGLIDTDTLRAAPAHPRVKHGAGSCARGTSASCTSYDDKQSGVETNKSGQKGEKTGPSQGQVRAKSDPVKPLNGTPTLAYSESSQASVENIIQAI